MTVKTDATARALLSKTLGKRTVFGTRDCARAIADRRDFRAGNMRGIRALGGHAPSSSWSQMPREIADRYAADNPVYVVFSYATPIGWITADGRAVVPKHNYSSSTARHQSEARDGLALAVVPDAVTVTSWGAVALDRSHGWAWVEGTLVSPGTMVTVSARRYRSRVSSDRVTIGTAPASEMHAIRSAAQGWGQAHPLISERWSDVRFSL